MPAAPPTPFPTASAHRHLRRRLQVPEPSHAPPKPGLHTAQRSTAQRSAAHHVTEFRGTGWSWGHARGNVARRTEGLPLLATCPLRNTCICDMHAPGFHTTYPDEPLGGEDEGLVWRRDPAFAGGTLDLLILVPALLFQSLRRRTGSVAMKASTHQAAGQPASRGGKNTMVQVISRRPDMPALHISCSMRGSSASTTRQAPGPDPPATQTHLDERQCELAPRRVGLPPDLCVPLPVDVLQSQGRGRRDALFCVQRAARGAASHHCKKMPLLGRAPGW